MRFASAFMRATNVRLAARDELGERDRRVVAGLHDHPVHQLVDRHRAARLDEHPRAFGVPRGGRHRDALRRRDLALAQRGEHEIRGHELGERRRLAPLVGVLRDDRRAAREIEEQIAKAPRSPARSAATAATGCGRRRGRRCGIGRARRRRQGPRRGSGETEDIADQRKRAPIITSSTRDAPESRTISTGSMGR